MHGSCVGFGKDVPSKNKSSDIYMYVLLFSMYISLELNTRCPCSLGEAELVSSFKKLTVREGSFKFIFMNIKSSQFC